LFFSLADSDSGFRVPLLGADTPLEQLPGALEKRHCAGIVLSCTSRLARGVLGRHLPDLVDRAGVPVFVGGSCANRYREQIASAGAICLDEAIANGLRLINKTLSAGLLRQPVRLLALSGYRSR